MNQIKFTGRWLAVCIALLSSLVASAQTNAVAQAPDVLPGHGLAQHDFLYAGEGKQEKLFIVRHGQVDWSYTHPGRGEISDAMLLSNGHILFAHQFGITEISADKQVVWNFDAPTNTEIHTVQPIGADRVVFIQNGDPAKVVVMNKTTSTVEHEFILPVKNPRSTHGQFRHARLTADGALIVAHMDLGEVREYDATGKVLRAYSVPGIWSATPLANGNILTAGSHGVSELDSRGATIWNWTRADAPDYRITGVQLASRLSNGDTLINNWFNEWSGSIVPANAPVQAVELTPEKHIVWALRSWNAPNLGPSTTIQLLDEPGVPADLHFGGFK
jgi:hypothetical protein